MKKMANVLLGWVFISQCSFAAVSLDHSRVIFTQGDKSQSISAYNSANKKYLIQSLVFSDLNAENESSHYFTVIPPIVKLDENSHNALKIIPKGLNVLPSDRESLFYLMVNFIPETKQRNNDENSQVNTKFNLSTKIVIKMFYRPKGIQGNIKDDINKLTVKQSGNKIIINNPSPYHYTLINIKMDGALYRSDRAPMVSPFSTFEIPINKKLSKLEWSIINDYGGETALNPVIFGGTQ
ncbi:molecular chaperone [Providencia sneebia]|uniref:Fimbrial chaperone n=1 Tax=Providencia sneebia DSM 19967 TaxID=1141660 RepID=K8WXD3_9GAMM|nr:molecular chaperone [Providencia sneebia]EKT60855.1 fimbrial chaperone [Providencia sneebia DSM 19967]